LLSLIQVYCGKHTSTKQRGWLLKEMYAVEVQALLERDTDHKECSCALEKEESKQVLLLRRAINVSAKLERISKVLQFEAAFLACAPQLFCAHKTIQRK
jgi:hypothetical protein